MKIFKKIITNNRIKILLVVLVSFLIVDKGTSQMFLADSPKINPEFITNIKNAPTTLAQLPGNIVSGIGGLFNRNNDFANVKTTTAPEGVAFQTISKGVYAGEDLKTGKSYLKVEAGTKYKIVGTVTINGKEYPKIQFVQ